MIAQGNALGSLTENKSSPVRAKHIPQTRAENHTPKLCRPFRAWEILGDEDPGRRCALPWASICRPCRAAVWRTSSAPQTLPRIPNPFEVCSNRLFQLGGFGELLFEFRGEAFRLLLERFAVVFGFFRTNVTTRREDESVRADFIELG